MPTSFVYENLYIVVLILVLLWLLFRSDGSAYPLSRSGLAALHLAHGKSALSLLNSSTWGDFLPHPSGQHASEKPRYLNLTGFRKGDTFAWADLDDFRRRCLAISRHAIPLVGGEDLWRLGEGEPVWQNVSGYVHGTWVRRNTSVMRRPDSTNLTAMTPWIVWDGAHSHWGRNATGREGRIKMRLYDKTPIEDEDANMVSALVTVEDEMGTGSTWDMRLHGVHWRKHGAILLSTTSEKFDGIFALPHLAPTSDFFASSRNVLNHTVGKRLQDKEKEIFRDVRIPWSSEDSDADPYSPSPLCEYIMYAQVRPPDRQHLDMASFNPETETMADIIRDIEAELRLPNGAPIRGIPELELSAVLFSPDCAFFLETKGAPRHSPAEGRHLLGMKAEVFKSALNACLLAYGAIFLGQVYLVKYQSVESSTPSMMGRVSLDMVSFMLIADGLVTMAVMVLMLSTDTSMSALALMFCAFMSTFIDMCLCYKLFTIQLPDMVRGRERDRDRASGDHQPRTQPADSLPLPATARPAPNATSPPVIIPSDQDIDAEIADVASGAAAVALPGANLAPPQDQTFSHVMGKFIITGTAILFLAIMSTTWYKFLRSAYLNSVVFLYLSLWVPQIYRNAMRNCRSALTWRFIVGQSLLRLAPLAYIYLKDENILFVEPSRTAFAVFLGWTWIQLCALAFQHMLGPRFCLPSSWCPDAWDYHRVLREDSIEAGALPLGLTPAPGSPSLERTRTDGAGREKRKSHARVIDCAICKEELEVPVLKAGEEDAVVSGVAGVFARRAYMVTPCRHIFHSGCLEGWLRFRLQCPICREVLPPL